MGVVVPLSCVVLKQNCGVSLGCSGVRDMMWLSRVGGGDEVEDDDDGAGDDFQNVAARLSCWSWSI